MVVVELVPGRLRCTTFVKFLWEVLKVLKSSSRTWAVEEDHMVVIRPHTHALTPRSQSRRREYSSAMSVGDLDAFLRRKKRNLFVPCFRPALSKPPAINGIVDFRPIEANNLRRYDYKIMIQVWYIYMLYPV